MLNYNVIIIIVATLAAGIALYFLYAIIMFKGMRQEAELQLTTKNVLENVRILYDKGEYALVELLAVNYLERVPSHREVRQYLAKTYYKAKKYNNAIKQCLIILKHDKKNFAIKKILADSYIEKGVIVKAIKEYEKLYEMRNDDAETVKSLAGLYKEAEQYTDAIAAYNILLDLITDKNEIANVHLEIAKLSEITYNYPVAFESYKNRLAIFPNDTSTNHSLAALYVKINNKVKAIETYQYILTITQDPKELLPAYQQLVQLYEETEDYENAIRYSQQMLEIQGADKFEVRNKIAFYYGKLQNYEESITILEDLSMISQNSYKVTLELADAYICCKQYQKALDSYNTLMDKATQQEAKELRTYMSNLYVVWAIDSRETNISQSYTNLNYAIQQNPLNPEIYYNIALNKIRQQLYNEAIEQLNKAIEYDKQKTFLTKYLLTMAEVHHELGNFFEEKKAITDLLSIDEKNAKALFMNGMLCINQHDFKNAETYLQKALTINPEMIIAKFNLATIYENNDKQKAKELYIEILEQDPGYKEAQTALDGLSFN